MPQISFDAKNRTLTSEEMIRVTRKHVCSKGTAFTIEMDWPKGLTLNAPVALDGVTCPCCQEPVEFPKAVHIVNENNELVSTPSQD
jgi:hypothetical protein